MKKNIRKIFLILLLITIAYSVTTGGMVIEFSGGFRWTSGHSALSYKTSKLQSSIRIVDNPSSFNLPFILWLLYSTGSPYPIELQITDNTKQAKWLTIESIEISFEDKTEKHVLQPPKRYDFKLSDLSFGVGDGTITNISVSGLKVILPISVKRDQTCSIFILGFIENIDGSKNVFKINETISYIPETRMYTLWSGAHD